MNVVVVGGGSWGTAFASVLVEHGHDVTLACRDPEQVAAIRETGRNPRYLGSVDLPPWPRRRSRGRCADANLVVVAVPSACVQGGRRRTAGSGADPQPDEGARPGDRRAALDRRARPAGGGPLGAEHRRGDRARVACGGGDRLREHRARRPAAARDQLDRLPRLRERRHRRGRALRRREERHRARRRRRRRARARGQRQGGARRPRSCRDGAPGRGLRRASRDLRRARGDGRPDRDLLVPPAATAAAASSSPRARRRQRRPGRSGWWSRA